MSNSEKQGNNEKQVPRRSFIKYVGAGVVVVAVAGAGGYYYLTQQPSAVTPTATSAVTSAATSAVTSAATSMTETPLPADDPLVFDIWAFRPEIPEGYAKTFDTTYNENCNVEVLTGDFFSLIVAKFMAKAKIDMCYTGAATAQQYYAARWLRGLNDLAKTDIVPYGVDDIQVDLRKGGYKWADAFTAPDGQLLGLPYFQSSRGAMLCNDLVLAKAGLDGPENYPKNYDELYTNIEKLAKAGVKEPYWPHWWIYPGHGISWCWIGEVVNREGEEGMFDPKTHEPTFDVNTTAAEVLKRWTWLWDNDYANHGIISMTNEGDYLAGFATGRYAYSGQQTYDDKTFNDPSFSKCAGHVSPAPPVDNGWGMMDGCGYSLLNQPWTPYKEERAKRMIEYFGYKDQTGNFGIAKNWLIQAPPALQSGYVDANQDPDVIASWKKWVAREQDIKTLDDLLKSTGVLEVWKTYWYMDWQTRVIEWLPLFLQKKKTLEETITGLRDYALELKKEYEF